MPIHFLSYGRHRNVHTAHFGAGDIEIIVARLEGQDAANILILRQLDADEQAAYGDAEEAPVTQQTDDMRSIDLVLRFETIRSVDTLIRTLEQIRKEMITAATAKRN